MIVLFICVFRNRDMEAVLGVWYRCQCGSYSEGGLAYALILVKIRMHGLLGRMFRVCIRMM